MNLGGLIARFRTEANDKVLPYFWSDTEITDWLNDAVEEAAIRGRMIYESEDAAVCNIAVVEGQSRYDLHSALYELVCVRLSYDGDDESKNQSLCLVSSEALQAALPDWRTNTDGTRFALQDDKGLRLIPPPTKAGVVAIEGYRLPLVPMQNNAESPEINAAHHRHLVNWALHKAFAIPDAEAFDPNRSEIARQAFSAYFGDSPDSDLRRITREDVQHHVEAFWV